MSSNATNQELLQAWKQGDQNAASLIYRRYQARLMALIRSRLSRKLARRLDPEDILLSAYRSFFVAARNGKVREGDDDNLWPVLTMIALRKLARQSRRHSAAQRSVERERQDDSEWIEAAISKEPTAEQSAELIDQIEQIMERLDPTAREVLIRTLQGYDTRTISEQLGMHERSVRRAQERIRTLLPHDSTADIVLSQIRTESLSNSVIGRVADKSSSGTTSYDQYLLQQFVGAGAFSKVYRGLERATGETVAIKFLRKECWLDDRARDALIREFELLRNLNHPHILTIRGWGTTPGGAMFLVTEFIHGRNLAEWREATRPGVQQIINVIQQVAIAVAITHSENIVHGDLKPSNVLMRDDGQTVLCDFGLARFATAPEDVPRGGTAGFLAPEQFCDAFGPITARSDVYGLGAMLYALLTGRPPMTGRDLPDLMVNVLSASRPEALSRFCSCPPEVEKIVLRCLEKEPSERYQSVLEFRDEIQRLKF